MVDVADGADVDVGLGSVVGEGAGRLHSGGDTDGRLRSPSGAEEGRG